MHRMDLERACGSATPVIGMVHLGALPGSPGFGGMSDVLSAARRDAATLARGGVDAVLVENYGDVPFYPGPVPAETIAALAVVIAEVQRCVDIPVGVNVLRNDARAALGIAAATGVSFMRVNVHTGAMLADQGWLSGMAHDTLRTRATLGCDVAILADVLVKHAVAPPGLTVGAAAADTWARGRADALIVTGTATGDPVDRARLLEVREAVPDAPLLVGSGLTEANAAMLLETADGAIVGSAFMTDGRAGAGVDADRVSRLLHAIRTARR